MSADADPSTGYVIYDSVNGLGFTAVGGTSGAAPLWAAVLAVAASADGNTMGYGAMNPILYSLAQQSPGTYLNDVTSGNNDYNATNGGQFAAATGYDMATGLGTPITSSLASGLGETPIDVAVTGTQVYGGTPSFGATVSVGGQVGAPFGVTVNTSGVTCSEVGTSTTISTGLPVGSDTLLASSCSGVTKSGPNASDYTLVYTSVAGDFTVTPIPVDVAVSGSQTFGGTPTFNWSASPPTGIIVSVSTLECPEVMLRDHDHAVTRRRQSHPRLGTVHRRVAQRHEQQRLRRRLHQHRRQLRRVARRAHHHGVQRTMTYGGTVPTITPGYSGFVNGNTASSLTTRPPARRRRSLEPGRRVAVRLLVRGGGRRQLHHQLRRRHGHGGTAPLTVTASSPTMTYGGAVPTITPGYSGFVNGDTASSLTTQPTCTTTATGSSPGGVAYGSSASARPIPTTPSPTSPDRSRSRPPRSRSPPRTVRSPMGGPHPRSSRTTRGSWGLTAQDR